MKEHLLVTAVGEDRPGIVSHLAEVITRHGANLEDSRMTVLGGEFAAIALVTVLPAKMPELLKDLESLAKEKISVTTRKTKAPDESRFKGYSTYQVSLTGADHEGIVHKISSYLKNHNINIQSMETELVPAPETGTPLFCMNAIVSVPPEINFKKLNEELNAIGQEEAVEVDLAAYIESGQEVGV
jgi:glycine cleavage system transcriptional repressor